MLETDHVHKHLDSERVKTQRERSDLILYQIDIRESASKMEDINTTLQKKIEILKSQCEDMIEESEINFAMKYSKEKGDVLYDGQLWTRLQLDQRILVIIERLQNRLLIKNRLNIADEKFKDIITRGSRVKITEKDPNKTEDNSPLMSNRTQMSRNAKFAMDNYSLEQSQQNLFTAFQPHDSILQKLESALESNKASERKSVFYLRDSVDNS